MPEEQSAIGGAGGQNWPANPNPGQVVGPAAPANEGAEVSWTASEFIAHQKTSLWYLMLVGAAAVITSAVFLVTKDKISSLTIAAAAIAMGVFASRQPRVLNYRLNDSGLTIGQKFYDWSQFKSFAILAEGALDSIYITPLKRLMPPITIYYAPEDEARILDVISRNLPMEERDHDIVDRLLRKIRF